MDEQRPDAEQWQVLADTPRDYYGAGLTWKPGPAAESLRRINQGDGPAEATAQAAAEAVMVLHSIRRILMGALVVVPAILTVLTIILMASLP